MSIPKCIPHEVQLSAFESPSRPATWRGEKPSPVPPASLVRDASDRSDFRRTNFARANRDDAANGRELSKRRLSLARSKFISTNTVKRQEQDIARIIRRPTKYDERLM